jgi:starch synthase
VFNVGGLEFFDQLNFLKGGVLYADAVTTVSRRYAQEIQSEEYGYNLASVFRSIRDRLFGITNGVEYEKWDPRATPTCPRGIPTRTFPARRCARAGSRRSWAFRLTLRSRSSDRCPA